MFSASGKGVNAMTAASHYGAGHRKRLKERYLKGGIDGFHGYEIIEALLTYSIPRRDVKPLAKALFSRFKGLRGLIDAAPEALSAIDGVGENTSMLIALAREAGRAYLSEEAASKDLIRSAQDVIEFMKPALAAEPGERLFAVYLNTRNEVLGVETLHEGPIDNGIPAREAIERAFTHNARSVIFVHSNPRNGGAPTVNEKRLTKALEAAASSIDIVVHDYLIAGEGVQFSARESGWLDGK